MGWLLFLLVVLVGYGFGIGLTLIIRRFQFGHPDDDAIAGIKLTGIYTVFAVILGFVTFSSWQFYLDASDSVRQEAASLSVINRSARALPPAIGQPVVKALADYVIAASDSEWDSQKAHVGIQAGRDALQNLNNIVTQLPASSSESVSNAQDNMMYYIGQIETSRADRVFFAEDADPSFVWALLALGGIMTVLFSATLHFKSKATHLQLVGSLSAIIAASLFTVYALNNPFSGPFPVKPQPLKIALESIQTTN